MTPNLPNQPPESGYRPFYAIIRMPSDAPQAVAIRRAARIEANTRANPPVSMFPWAEAA